MERLVLGEMKQKMYSDLFGWWGRKGMVRLYLPLAPFEKMFVCLAAGIGTSALLTSPAFLGYSYLEKVCWETIGGLLF